MHQIASTYGIFPQDRPLGKLPFSRMPLIKETPVGSGDGPSLQLPWGHPKGKDFCSGVAVSKQDKQIYHARCKGHPKVSRTQEDENRFGVGSDSVRTLELTGVDSIRAAGRRETSTISSKTCWHSCHLTGILLTWGGSIRQPGLWGTLKPISVMVIR